jgi:hypothetical protein
MNTETDQELGGEGGSGGLSFGHLGIVVLCAIVLIFTGWMKDGFNFELGRKASRDKYTYAQAEADALSQLASVDNPANSVDASQRAGGDAKIAMIDPLSDKAQVLGTSTGTLLSVLPKPEDILSPEVQSKIKINLLDESDASSSEAIVQYKRDVAGVESADSVEQILADVNNTDPKILLEGSKMIEPLVTDLVQVRVPKELAEYHKLKIFYYLEMSELADGYAGVKGVADPKDTGLNIFSLTNRLEQIQADIQNKYGVQL